MWFLVLGSRSPLGINVMGIIYIYLKPACFPIGSEVPVQLCNSFMGMLLYKL